MPSENRPFGVAETIIASFTNLWGHFRAYLVLAAITTGLTLIAWLAELAISQTEMGMTGRYLAGTAVYVMVSLPAMALTLSFVHATWKRLGKKAPPLTESIREGFRLLPSFVWIGFLTGMALLAAPAFLLLMGFVGAASILPHLAAYGWLGSAFVATAAALGIAVVLIPIYYLLATYFSANFLVMDGLRGWPCLLRSFSLVRGRWWKAFWRLGIPSLFFWLAVQVILETLETLFGLAFGGPPAPGSGLIGLAQAVPIMVISHFIVGLSYPLFVGVNLIVWNDLKRLEGKE